MRTAKDGIPELSVSELTSQIKFSLNELFFKVWVRGEISDLVRARSGHLYFNLKDEQSRISAVMWKSQAARVRFDLEEGVEVLCQGSIDVYPPRGSYQLSVVEIQPVGIGELQLAFQRLHKKLQAEGLFDPARKRPIPKFPRQIGVVTSTEGAAIRDFLQVLRRRSAQADVLIIPTRVQGKGAEVEIARAIRRANQLRVAPDVLVVCRGGGSAEDLWCFNEEVVCRAVFESQIPIVSAIGHEIDVSLCDLVADVRALTPSEAAELVAPDSSDQAETLEQWKTRLVRGLNSRFQQARDRLETVAESAVFRHPLQRIFANRQGLDELQERMSRSTANALKTKRHLLELQVGKLESLSPLRILAGGYSVTTDSSGRVLRSILDSETGNSIFTRLLDGTIESKIVGKAQQPIKTTISPEIPLDGKKEKKRRR